MSVSRLHRAQTFLKWGEGAPPGPFHRSTYRTTSPRLYCPGPKGTAQDREYREWKKACGRKPPAAAVFGQTASLQVPVCGGQCARTQVHRCRSSASKMAQDPEADIGWGSLTVSHHRVSRLCNFWRGRQGLASSHDCERGGNVHPGLHFEPHGCIFPYGPPPLLSRATKGTRMWAISPLVHLALQGLPPRMHQGLGHRGEGTFFWHLTPATSILSNRVAYWPFAPAWFPGCR